MQHLSFEPVKPSATPTQLQALRQLMQETFVAAFGHNYTQADLDAYCQQAFSLPSLMAQLADPVAHFYGVYLADALVGYLKWQVPASKFLTPTLTQRHPDAFYLERFYFLEQAQGKGVAAVAMQFALSHAHYVHQCSFAYLTVWEHNLKAQHFYQNFGFRTLGTVGFEVGQAIDREYLYGKVL